MSALPPLVDQPSLPQGPEVLGEHRLRHPERVTQVDGGALPGGQRVQKRPPGRIGDRPKDIRTGSSTAQASDI